jgi:hypothetical protein
MLAKCHDFAGGRILSTPGEKFKDVTLKFNGRMQKKARVPG